MDLLDLRERFRRNGLLICFSGPFHQGLIAELGTGLRERLRQDPDRRDHAQDVFAVFVEQAQNVRNYVMHREALGLPLPGEGRPILVIGLVSEGHYQLRAGNLVAPEDVAPLAARIDHLKDMDKAALKAFFKEQIRKPRDPTQGGGAGVGLVDMARRGTRPLEYSFGPAEEGHQFFTLSVIV